MVPDMQLEYYPKTGAFCLFVDRAGDGITPREVMNVHGWDMSEPASTPERACFFTTCEYAAAAFNPDIMSLDASEKLWPLLLQIEASKRDYSEANIKCPDDKELWPFQKAGIEYALQRTHTLIGDQPGLGKTAQAICYANEINAKHVLVVCPANIRLQWAKQIRAWTTMQDRPIIYPILKSSDGVHPRANWTIISYDLLRSDPIHRALYASLYDCIILDEAHYLKTPSARRTTAIFSSDKDRPGLANRTGSILGLTGTPLPNRPRECYTIARAFDWGSIDWQSERAFQDKYNPSATFEKKNPFTGQIESRFTKEKVGRLPELRSRLRSHFMVRRLKRDVLTQLPEIRHEIVHVEETGEIRKALEAESLLHIDPENLAGIDAQVLGHVAAVRRMMGLAKAPQVAEYVNMLLEGGEDKIVLFGWHINVLDILETRLAKWGVLRVDGSTSPVHRQRYVDQFQTDQRKRVFLANLQAIGVGVDGLQNVCSHAIFAECSWTPSDNEQGIGRLERIGQSSGILAEFLVAPGSFDERVLGSSLRKARNIHNALDQEH